MQGYVITDLTPEQRAAIITPAIQAAIDRGPPPGGTGPGGVRPSRDERFKAYGQQAVVDAFEAHVIPHSVAAETWPVMRPLAAYDTFSDKLTTAELLRALSLRPDA